MKRRAGTLHFSTETFIQQIFAKWMGGGVVCCFVLLSGRAISVGRGIWILSCRQRRAITSLRAGACVMKAGFCSSAGVACRFMGSEPQEKRSALEAGAGDTWVSEEQMRF